MQPSPQPVAVRLAAALARLEASIDWERRRREKMRVSTEPERELLLELGRPDRGPRVVHVTGSKGKGSVSALIGAALSHAGLRTGVYASPHVERLNERISVDGAEIGDGDLASVLEAALDARERVLARRASDDASEEPTWFDVVTAAALLQFARARVQWIVAECGLGGRLDSTNVLAGEVCVITNIELEHTAVLGATHAAIAAEKAGILKPGCTLVSGVPAHDEAGRVIDARAASLGVRVLRPAYLDSTERASVDERNRALARLVLDELGRRGHTDERGVPLGVHLVDAAARRVRLPARMERFVVGGVPVVLDGGHTPVSVGEVLRDLASDPALPGKPVVVLGMARDKDLAGILKTLAGGADRVVSTSVGSDLHRSPEEIAEAAGELGMAAETAATPRDALERALGLARTGRWVLVTGSLYLAGALRPHLDLARENACSPSSPISS